MAIKTFPKGSGERLSKNFKAYEFDCRCDECTETKIDLKLVEYLQQIRDHFGVPVLVSSGCRCQSHNAAVGGVYGSKHMLGMAADIVVVGVAPAEVAKYAESMGILGIGLYEKAGGDDDFVHVDTRTSKAFWYGSAQLPRTTFGGAQAAQKPAEEETEETYVPITVDLPVLRKGVHGDTVEAVQIMLKGRGYDLGTFGPNKDGIDGHFGNATENAVMCLQEDLDLNDGDGIVGALEWKALLGL